MSADPYPSFPHNSWWRRLRRRYFVHPLTLVRGVLFGYVPAIGSVSWLLHGPFWLTVVCGALWVLSNLFIVQLFLLSILSRRSIPLDKRLGLIAALVLYAITTVVLLMGRVDLAFYLVFGVTVWGELLLNVCELSFRTFVRLMLSLALCLAFATDAGWVVVGLLLLKDLPWERHRPKLVKWIRGLPTRAEYVARNREACAKGSRCGPPPLLQLLCEVELWEEALIELQRQSYSPVIRKCASVYKATIYIGMKRYQEVLDLEAEGQKNAVALEAYLAIAHARLGHAEEALRLAEEALRLKRAGAQLVMGHVYSAREQHDLALRWYESAAQNVMDRAAALGAMGRALIALGDYREACVVFEQVIRMKRFVRPDDLLQLAECYRRTDQEAAAAQMEQLAHEKA